MRTAQKLTLGAAIFLTLTFASLFAIYGTLAAFALDGGNIIGLWQMNSWIGYPGVALGLTVLVSYYARAVTLSNNMPEITAEN
jgi:hypothetical protein